MTTILEIPPEAICHVCGKPMRVVHHEELAAALGFKIPEGEIVTIECCEYQIRIEDDDARSEVIRILESYHAGAANGVAGDGATQASEVANVPSGV